MKNPVDAFYSAYERAIAQQVRNEISWQKTLDEQKRAGLFLVRLETLDSQTGEI